MNEIKSDSKINFVTLRYQNKILIGNVLAMNGSMTIENNALIMKIFEKQILQINDEMKNYI